MVSGIYQIKNIFNGKIYIGSAKNIRTRIINHRSKLSLGNHPNKKLQNAWNKYGESSFLFETVEIVIDLRDLIKKEQFYLDKLVYASSNDGRFNLLGHNICRIAGGKLGTKISEATRLKMSYSQKKVQNDPLVKEKSRNTNLTEGTKKLRSLSAKNRTITDETKMLMSSVRKNYLQKIGGYSKETLHKMSISKKGLPANNKLAINQFSLDGIFIERYESLEEAERILKLNGCRVSRSKISLCLHGKRNKAGGYKWVLADL